MSMSSTKKEKRKESRSFTSANGSATSYAATGQQSDVAFMQWCHRSAAHLLLLAYKDAACDILRTFSSQAGIDSRVHLIRILAQNCAHGGADRRRSLNLKRVAPCHSSCTSPCTRFGNSQRVSNNNWRRMCAPMLVDQSTTQRRAARTIAVYIHHPTTSVRTTRAYRRISLRNSRTYSFAQLQQHLTGTSSSACTRTVSSWLHTMHRNSVRECHNCSVVFRRSTISTGYSQAITAELSAGCKGSIHGNSTPIPLQTHGNR